MRERERESIDFFRFCAMENSNCFIVLYTSLYPTYTAYR